MKTVKDKLTIEDIKSVIVNEHYTTHDQLTICVLTLKNGYKVTGESACVNPANFDPEIGKTVAYERAIREIWVLEGYLLAQKRYEEAENAKS